MRTTTVSRRAPTLRTEGDEVAQIENKGSSAGEGGTTEPRLAEGRTNALKTKGVRTAAV